VSGLDPALALGFVPVLLFLAGLIFMDSYKLVRRHEVFLSLGGGALAATAALGINVWLVQQAGIDGMLLKRYVAPLIEEILKAAIIVYLIRAEKVGFMVDAGIHGFALGTGFALIENFYYALFLGSGEPLVWLVRGLGTAVMHGSVTAIIGILSKDLTDRHESRSLYWFLPGLGIAFAIHSGYNHLILNPLYSTAILLAVMPMLLLFVFSRSEKATQDWLGTGLDNDVELLEQITSGEVVHSRAGQYLDSLRHRLPGSVVADMLCLLQIHLELSMRAKGMLIARAAGVEVEIDDEIRANFAELKYLERAIGETGQIAIMPLRKTSSRDLWQLTMLEKKGK
jgi:RsiW-degrading membrane proteinase PrsW (M82 family)